MVGLMGNFNTFQLKFKKSRVSLQFIQDMTFFSNDAREDGNYLVFTIPLDKEQDVSFYLGVSISKPVYQ